VLGDGACSGEVGLDHLDEPWLIRCDAVAVEESLEIGEQEAMVGGELADAVVVVAVLFRLCR
jgi:hypothetical protein